MDPAQIEQEIEKEALEVTATTAEGGDEEDTTLADIEGRLIEYSSIRLYFIGFRWSGRRCWSE